MDRLGIIPAANRDSNNNDIPLKSYAPGQVIGQYHSNSAQPQCQHVRGWLHSRSLTTFQTHVQELSEFDRNIINYGVVGAGCTMARYVLLAGE